MALGLISGLATWFAGSPGAGWVFGAHTLAGAAVTLLLVFKLRRVLPRVGARAHRDPRTLRGLLALGLVVAVLVSGTVWSTAGRVGVAGYTVLFWHAALGAALAVVVLAHARVRARRPRPRDLTNRRQFLTAAALGAGALAAWQLQRPALRTLGLPGAGRRFTGSYDAGSFTGNAFPTTSWVADRPRPLAGGYRLTVAGRVRRPLAVTAAELDRRDALTATLDCTGGFFSTQHWRGVSLGRLLDEAGVRPGARHVRVISRTGYRWSFDLRDARALLLATHVGGVPLSHGRGAPCRLVAPGRRGFSGSSGSSASRSTRIPTRARSPRRSGAASPPPAAAQRTLVYEAYEDAVEWADDDTDEAVLDVTVWVSDSERLEWAAIHGDDPELLLDSQLRSYEETRSSLTEGGWEVDVCDARVERARDGGWSVSGTARVAFAPEPLFARADLEAFLRAPFDPREPFEELSDALAATVIATARRHAPPEHARIERWQLARPATRS